MIQDSIGQILDDTVRAHTLRETLERQLRSINKGYNENKHEDTRLFK